MTILNRRKLINGLLGSGLAASILPFSQTLARSPAKKLGVALVGLGYYSRDLLAPALQLTSYCELRGIVTGSPEKIPVWQKQYGIADKNVYNYDNLAQIANNPDIDIVYVVVPTFLHKHFTVMAANAGKHVWCEKPMAMTVGECQDMMSACAKNKVKLSIGYRMLHEPNTQTVMQFAQTKPYGPIQTMLAQAGYTGNGEVQGHWRMDLSKGGGALYDMGVYPINALRSASALEPIAVTAQHKILRPELFKLADETTEFVLEFAGGITAKGAASVGETYNKLRVDCQSGWYALEPMQAYSGVKGMTSDGKKLNKTVANQQAKQMDDDALAIINDTPVVAPGLVGLQDIRVVEGALLSARQNKRIELS